MYAEDTFFNLSPLGQVGLVCVAGSMAMAWALLAHAITRNARWWDRAATGLTAFWSYVILSPQVFYWYFRLLFDIPDQWIVRWQGPGVIADLLLFRADASLSHHGQGIFGWALIFGLAVLPRRRKSLPPDP